MEPKKKSPCFFKVLINPSSSYLPLPLDFVSHYLKNKIPPNPTLNTQNGEFSWKLKIEKIDGNYCFAHGWDDVVKDVCLGYGDFLVFWQTHPSIFKVLIFGPNGLAKDLSSLNSNLKVKNVVRSEDDDDEESTMEVKDAEDPSFEIMISGPSLRYMLRFPQEFTRDSKIHNKRNVTLEDPVGRQWLMTVHAEFIGKYMRCFLASGWRSFQKENDLRDGDLCLFKFVRKENKLVVTKMTNNQKSKENDDSPVKRKRGRPRLVERPPSTEIVKRKRGRPPLLRRLR